jgi:uncharacterized lipoprotein YehR (DUF1307 family)
MSLLKGLSVIIFLWCILISVGCGKSEQSKDQEQLLTTKKHLESVLFVENKCSKCHPMDRIHKALGNKNYKELEEIVDRMRMKPESGISEADAEKILEAFNNFYMMRPAKP